MPEIFIWNCCGHFIMFVLFMLLQRIFVAIMVYVPFMIWKFVNQNIFCHSPHILTTLPTSGFNFSFCNLKRIGRMMKQCRAFKNFYLRLFTGRSGDDVVVVKMYLQFWIWIYLTKMFGCTPHIIWQHSPPLGVIFIFLIWKCIQARRIKEFWGFENFYWI